MDSKAPTLVSAEDRKIFENIKDYAQNNRYSDFLPAESKTQPKTLIRRLEDITNIVYINLKQRSDRRIQCEAEFARLGLTAKRIDAIKCTPGSLGCTMSHIKCLELAKRNNWDHIWINEDDLTFTMSRSALDRCVTQFFAQHLDWKVLMFHAIVLKGKKEDQHAVRVQKSWCTTSYLVQRPYYDVLLHNFYEGASRLYRDPASKQHVDVFWKSLQTRDQWYLLQPLAAQQRIGYSDIDNQSDKDLVGTTTQFLSSIDDSAAKVESSER